jgi:hypothetical protein
MSLKFVQIADRGVPNKERVHLTVVEPADISYFMLAKSFLIAPNFNTVFTGGSPAFWFPSRMVKQGETIIVYTGAGIEATHMGDAGVATHFFYWGMPQTIFNDPAACVVVMRLATWATSPQGA